MASADEQRPGIRPRATLARRLDLTARHAFPASCTILLMLLTEVPLGIVDQTSLLPAVALASVWFWSLYRPGAMSPPVVFAIGLLLDLLDWLPIGTGVLTLLLTHGVAQRWRRGLSRHGFALVWLAFAIVAAGAAALDWVATAVLTWRLVPPDAMLFQAVLSAALYPVLGHPVRAGASVDRQSGAGVMRPAARSGLRPETRQGALPPGPPAKAEPLQPLQVTGSKGCVLGEEPRGREAVNLIVTAESAAAKTPC